MDVHDAALAAVTPLPANPGVLVFVASHVSEVVPGIADDAQIRFLHFAADVAGDRPRFDYQLRKGTSHQRLRMTLLQHGGVLDLLDRRTTVPSGTPSWLAQQAEGESV